MRDLAVAIDIGGTNSRAALIAGNGRLLARASIATDPRRGMESGLNRIAAAVTQVIGATPANRICGIGIATPGLADPRRGVAFALANLPGWTSVPLKDHFERRFAMPVSVGNDANLAALAERRFGAGRGCDDMIYMTISTGIGGGIISNGRLVLGANGFAGEVGHITVEPGGPRCNCGNVGCLETLASGTAIARQARAALDGGASSLIPAMAGGSSDNVSAVTVARAFAAGDALAGQIIQRAALYVGIGVVNLIHLFNPRRVVIGGGVSLIGEPLFTIIRQTVKERAFARARRYVRIVPAALGDDVGLLGAATLALGQAGD